jgi:hypothetical protein
MNRASASGDSLDCGDWQKASVPVAAKPKALTALQNDIEWNKWDMFILLRNSK